MRPFSLDFLGDVLFWYIKRDKIFLYTNRSVLVMKKWEFTYTSSWQGFEQ